MSRSIPGRAAAAVLLTATLLPAGAAAQSPSAPPMPSVPPQVGWADDADAIPTVPTPGAIADPQPVGWDHVRIWPDGRSLTVSFWNGAEACYGLDRVELEDVDGTLAITLYTGFRNDAANKRCMAVQQLYTTVIELESPILGGGVEGIVGAQPTSERGQPITPGAQIVPGDPTRWELVTVGPDGRSVDIGFWGGTDACFGLAGVDVAEGTDGVPVLSLRYGTLASLPPDTACIAIAVVYSAFVQLEAPILLGGER